MRKLLLPLILLALAGCREEIAARPEPVAMTEESTGHFCQMHLLEHSGPKAQVHLKGVPHPLFFSQVRDAAAFKLLPEQEGEILAIYVSDMQKGSWDDPGATNWVDADAAYYVVGSRQRGGMGSPELIPFGTDTAAQSFAAQHGGTVQRLDEIAPEVVLAADGPTQASDEQDDSDFAQRLKALSDMQDKHQP